jgi:hypothetical protein
MAEPTFEVIGLGPPADGWRAIFSGDNGASIAPLVCWGVLRKKTPGQPDQTLISGVITDRQPGGPIRFLIAAAELDNFEGYLEPGEPDPPSSS